MAKQTTTDITIMNVVEGDLDPFVGGSWFSEVVVVLVVVILMAGSAWCQHQNKAEIALKK